MHILVKCGETQMYAAGNCNTYQTEHMLLMLYANSRKAVQVLHGIKVKLCSAKDLSLPDTLSHHRRQNNQDCPH